MLPFYWAIHHCSEFGATVFQPTEAFSWEILISFVAVLLALVDFVEVFEAVVLRMTAHLQSALRSLYLTLFFGKVVER